MLPVQALSPLFPNTISHLFIPNIIYIIFQSLSSDLTQRKHISNTFLTEDGMIKRTEEEFPEGSVKTSETTQEVSLAQAVLGVPYYACQEHPC